MKTLRPSTQYKKDLKRIRNNPKKAEALLEVLRLLENELPIPPIYKPHMLTSDYAGCMECHIQGDFLLIWIDQTTNDIDLVRLGSHSELFGKGAKRLRIIDREDVDKTIFSVYIYFRVMALDASRFFSLTTSA